MLKDDISEYLKRSDIMENSSFPRETISAKSIPEECDLRRFCNTVDDYLKTVDQTLVRLFCDQ